MGFLTKNRIWIILSFVLIACCACNKVSTPKPYTYFRIATPDTAYLPFVSQFPNYPYTFDLSRNAVAQPVDNEPYWVNLYYPDLDATIHCSYKPVRRNLRELTNDALDLVYRNANFASAIPEQGYSHPEARVYGVLFDLEGNTASSCQFFVTDSVHHFFRASVYCNCHPNADSLAPVYNYLRKDVIRMVETFEWKRPNVQMKK
jgi:gliding motility-associated lipoprotein GldD